MSSIYDVPESSLFQAVASRDYNRIVQLYAKTAFGALSSHYASKRRSPLNTRYRVNHRSEEKVDENSPSQKNLRSLSINMDTCHDVDIETLEVLKHLMRDDSCPSSKLNHIHANLVSVPTNSTSTLDEFDRSYAVGRRSDRHQANFVTQPNNHESAMSARKDDKNDPVNIAEIVMHDSALYLSNMKPEPSFILHTKGKFSTSINSGEARDYVDADDIPLFDGMVAHATPGHGAGTILHLACILDSPLTLAILIAMHADLSSRYTPFRRSVVHEAACSDSLMCLTLLAEMSMEMRKEAVNYAGFESPTSTLESYVFRASGIERKRTKSGDTTHFVTNKDVDTRETLSFVGTLKLVADISKIIQSGGMTELDAARNLLRQINLSLANKTSIVEAFTDAFDKNKYTGIAHDHNLTGRDGHGNSALHWAAFKNSTRCASFLLSLGFDPNIKAAASGWTPLHDAAYSDSSLCVDILLKSGADINAAANSGATPLCFAAQENAHDAVKALLDAGADPTIKSCGQLQSMYHGNIGTGNMSRFCGYTALHYSAHYNADKTARVLLDYSNRFCWKLLEIPDAMGKLPIHIAAQRGSSEVMRALLHAGARIDTYDDLCFSVQQTHAPLTNTISQSDTASSNVVDDSQHLNESNERAPFFPPREASVETLPNVFEVETAFQHSTLRSSNSNSTVITPVSSPVLRSMVPPRPVSSSKPWNCVSQRSIDECNLLLNAVESNWSPEHHSLFYPSDRQAVVELLRVGKRLEQLGTGIFIELWPLVLSYCSRGWFEPSAGCSKRTQSNSLSEDHSSSTNRTETDLLCDFRL